MPVPPHVAAEARRCLARFRLPAAALKRPCPPRADVPSRDESETEPAAPGCREPSAPGAATATLDRPRPTIADDDARADGGRPSNIGLLAPVRAALKFSLSRSSHPSTLGDRVMPPSFPSRSNGSESVSGPVKESQPEEEEDALRSKKEAEAFSHHSERAVYQEYHQSMSRKCGQQDLPEGVMSISLYKYQKMGLDWMLFRENSSHCAGGLLADQQGLGKTIQVIALVLKERAQQSKFMSIDPDREATVINKEPKDLLFHRKPAHLITAKPAGGTLLVCPKCLLTQWDEELSDKIEKDAKLSVHVYYGCSRTMDSQELTKHDVVITTYKMVKQHFNSRKKRAKKKPSASDGYKNNPIAGVRWFRIVLDEAHELKNGDSLVAKACWELEAKRRWCLSGTPVQNKFDDLYSYLRFLRYRPYSEYNSFRSLLKEQNSTYESHGKTKLEILWGIVRLRRTEDTHIDGEPIIKLPPKTIQTIEITFTPAEEEFYSWLVQCYEETLMDNNVVRILALLKERQLACDHPCLVKSRIDYEQRSTIFKRSYVSSKMKAIIDILNSIVNKHAFTECNNNIESSTIESAPEKVLVFSQFTMMLDLLQPLLNTNGIQFRRFDGKMNRKARDEAVEDFKRNPEVTVLLMSLKAGGAGLNLSAASHVIITDPWWNPSMEDQAIGRAHRIGQTRPVTVYRLVVKATRNIAMIEGTIEERVLKLQESKRTNVNLVNEGKNILRENLTKDDVKFLYGGTRQS